MAKRIEKELAELTKNPPVWLKTKLAGDNVREWKVQLTGPETSPYEGGLFSLTVKLPDDYPFKPPKVNFDTKVWHPSINVADGTICVGILDAEWSPQSKIFDVMLVLRQLLAEPNPDHPFNTDAAQMLQTNKAQFVKQASSWTKQYAK